MDPIKVTPALIKALKLVRQTSRLDKLSPAMKRRVRGAVKRTQTGWALSALGEEIAGPMQSAWVPFEPPEPPKCDICGKTPRWQHPEGGLRCSTCPRPEK